jgi:hypothetical protein
VADILEQAALCALQLICTCRLRRAACLLLRHSLDADSAPQAHSVAASRWAHSRWFQCDERRVCELCLLAAGQPTRRTPH